MTVIIESVENIAGADDSTQFEFASAVVRENAAGTGLITRAPLFLVAEDGVLTTPNLDPGATTVRIGQRSFNITIPDSNTPVRLMPLIEDELPTAPPQLGTAVVNGGGIARVQKITESAYAALITPDPETEYSVIPD